MSDNTLQYKLQEYTKNLKIHDLQLFQYTVSHFIIIRDIDQYRKFAKMFEEDVQKVLIHEINQFIKSSFLTYSLQKAIFYFIQNDFDFQKTVNKFDLNINDLYYCWNILDNITKSKLIEQSKNTATELLTEEYTYNMLENMKAYCRNVAKKYLRFIGDYDIVYGVDDLVQDLLMYALVIIRRYDDFKTGNGEKDIEKIMNYTKAAVFRHAINLIKRNTNSKRTRIENISLACGYCEYCLKDEPYNCIYTVPQYQPTVLSLDYVFPSTNNRDVTFYEILEDKEEHTVDYTIKQEIHSEKIARFIDIVAYNQTDEEFDIWLKENYNLIVDDILPNYKVLAKYVMEFLQLNVKQVMSVLTSKCSTWSRKETAHCSACVSFSVCKERHNIRKNSKACDFYKM